jgi:transcriptional regulator with XRE-family HTH domain
MDNELIVNSIKKLCDKNNIPIGQFEKEAGLSKGLISKWKEKTPSLDKIVAIADYFNVSVDEVIGRNINIEEDLPEYDIVLSLMNLTQNETLKWQKMKYKDNYKINDVDYEDAFEIYEDNVEIYETEYEGSYIFIVAQYVQETGKIYSLDITLFIQADNNSNPVLQDTSKSIKDLWLQVREKIIGIPDEFKSEKIKDEIINKSKELQSDDSNIQPNIDAIKENKEILDKLNTPEIKKLISVFSDPKMNETIKSVQNLVTLYNKK